VVYQLCGDALAHVGEVSEKPERPVTSHADFFLPD
jgi:hypothetical protein